MRKGDCYQAAGRFMMDSNGSDNLTLVHGEVQGQGQLEGVRFGHAWIEKGNLVIDKSNGRNLNIPKELYYLLGDIKNTVRYSYDEFLSKVAKYKHWGPWE